LKLLEEESKRGATRSVVIIRRRGNHHPFADRLRWLLSKSFRTEKKRGKQGREKESEKEVKKNESRPRLNEGEEGGC
jgi:hypothetical protein